MPTYPVCPACGEHMNIQTKTNTQGDDVWRYLCGSCGYASEWEGTV